MLQAYKNLEALGVIGRMMKVDQTGKEIYDPRGDQPGQLVARPFQEYPKVLRRMRTKVDAEGKLHELVVEQLVNSKSEELKWLGENTDLTEARSPVEVERDVITEQLSVQMKINGELEKRLGEMMEKMERMLAAGASGAQASAKPSAPSAPPPNTVPGQTAEQRATAIAAGGKK